MPQEKDYKFLIQVSPILLRLQISWTVSVSLHIGRCIWQKSNFDVIEIHRMVKKKKRGKAVSVRSLLMQMAECN